MRALVSHRVAGRAASTSRAPQAAATTVPATPRYLGSSSAFCGVSRERLEALQKDPLTHVPPTRLAEHVCIRLVRFARFVSDRLFRDKLIHRALMSHYVAFGAPMAAARAESWRGIVHGTAPRNQRLLLGEYENRRAHAAVLHELIDFRRSERLTLALLQVILAVFWRGMYCCSPRAAHRLAGYSAEECTVLLTHLINDVDVGKVTNAAAPAFAVEYWRLGLLVDSDEPPALRDVALLLRADEMRHRDAHHALADSLAPQPPKR